MAQAVKVFPAPVAGHLYQGAKMSLGEGFFQVRNRFNLAIAHSTGRQRIRETELGQAIAKSVRFRQQFGERLGTMEREDGA